VSTTTINEETGEIIEDETPETPEDPETDGEPDMDGEPEPEPEPGEGGTVLSEKDAEKAAEKLEREDDRHAKRIGEIMGEDSLMLVRCEFCEPGMSGFHWPASMLPADDSRVIFYEAVGGGVEEQMVQPDRYQRCEYCKGFGQVRTGSRNALTANITCPKCLNAGYMDMNPGEGANPQAPAMIGGGNEQQTPEMPAEETDFLGRPRSHPNFGKLGQYLTAEELALDVRDGFASAS
jgi:hypothetical protein